MSHRILILTAGFGEGHNAAARALEAGFVRNCGPGTALVADAFALASPRLNDTARKVYLTLINRAPGVWSHVYDWIDRSNLIERRPWIFRREIRALADLIARVQPSTICCTYPLYAFFLNHIATNGRSMPPTYNVVTDSISIHSLWWRSPCAGWFLPNDDSAAVLHNAGVAPAAVHVHGFPVSSFFAANAGRLSPPELSGNTLPRVLHIINSGTRRAEETARRLFTETDWDVTCTVGRDRELEQRLSRVAAKTPRRARVLGWTDQIPHLLMTHHAVVTKAGGATTQEAIAARCPMVFSQVVPGQEEGNYELIRRHKAGALAETPRAVLACLNRAFANSGQVWRQWRAALRPLAHPDAAGDIARHVLAAPSWAAQVVLTTGEPGFARRSAVAPARS